MALNAYTIHEHSVILSEVPSQKFVPRTLSVNFCRIRSMFVRAQSFTHSLFHSLTHPLIHSLTYSHTVMRTTDCHLLDLTLECNHSQTVTNKIFVAPCIGMIASTVIAVKVCSWIGAPTVCNLLPTDSFAGIGVLRTGLKIP